MYSIIDIKTFSDDRGILKKVFMKSEADKIGFSIEEAYTITFNKKSIIRGEHFHEKTIEIFHVIQGKCLFELIENEKIISVELDASEGKAIIVMNNTPHRIISKVDNCVVLALSSKEYREDDTDTFVFDFERFKYDNN